MTNPNTAWHYLSADRTQLGPVDTATLKDLVVNGEIARDQRVWTNSYGKEWKRVDSVPELADALAAQKKGTLTIRKKERSGGLSLANKRAQDTVDGSRDDTEFSSIDVNQPRKARKGTDRDAMLGSNCFFWIATCHILDLALYYLLPKIGIGDITVLRLGIADLIRSVPADWLQGFGAYHEPALILVQAALFFIISTFTVLGRKRFYLGYILGMLLYAADASYWFFANEWEPVALHLIMLFGLTYGLIGSLVSRASARR